MVWVKNNECMQLHVMFCSEINHQKMAMQKRGEFIIVCMCIPGVEISLVVKQHLSTLVVAIEGSQVKRCVDIFVFVENALSLVPQQDLENTARNKAVIFNREFLYCSTLQHRVSLLNLQGRLMPFWLKGEGEGWGDNFPSHTTSC